MAITDRLSHGTKYVELEGTSQDTKPLEGIGINSKFFELDTKKEFYFDGEDWQEIGGQ